MSPTLELPSPDLQPLTQSDGGDDKTCASSSEDLRGTIHRCQHVIDILINVHHRVLLEILIPSKIFCFIEVNPNGDLPSPLLPPHFVHIN